jgi:hypothetical protein
VCVETVRERMAEVRGGGGKTRDEPPAGRRPDCTVNCISCAHLALLFRLTSVVESCVAGMPRGVVRAAAPWLCMRWAAADYLATSIFTDPACAGAAVQSGASLSGETAGGTLFRPGRGHPREPRCARALRLPAGCYSDPEAGISFYVTCVNATAYKMNVFLVTGCSGASLPMDPTATAACTRSSDGFGYTVSTCVGGSYAPVSPPATGDWVMSTVYSSPTAGLSCDAADPVFSQVVTTRVGECLSDGFNSSMWVGCRALRARGSPSVPCAQLPPQPLPCAFAG